MKQANNNRLYRILEWIMWMMYLNILWIGGWILGLGILGFFPATMATVVTIREWREGDGDLSFTKTFFRAWKKHFIKANVFGYFYLLIGFILYIDYFWLLNLESSFASVLFVLFILLVVLYVVSLLYLFPVYAHFDTGFFQTIRHAIILGFFSPIMTILMGICLAVIAFTWLKIQGLIVVVGVSVPLYFVTSLALTAFHSFKEKQDLLVENESLKKGEKSNA
ncbi:putative membrane protein YesL [Gracilibacillus halotolerans]|uniref:Putative membrane protein YesL n=1 Tax=Gracilibacillus halotolerans TaxID=74386 RepID=A0A841RHU0_9BACI|nr:DUF624 domain-containing protein [Gracilibacillus halotolerans]MBB6512221.1 putative membrane protein YesL [Gracilibacillus halotolerans]